MSDTRHLTRLSRIALMVAAVDLVTKAVAKAYVVHDPHTFAAGLQLAVVHNDAGAFGWSAGVYTWQLNLALTLAAIVFMIPVTRDLARVDRTAPMALGLIVGGALGNLTSLITSPAGVVDFIALNFERWGIVLNVADVAAYAGLVMIVRTGALIATAIVRDRRVRLLESTAPVRALFAEREALRAERRARRERRERHERRPGWGPNPAFEVSVADWSDVGTTPAAVADASPAPEPVIDGVIPLERGRRRRVVLGEITRPRSVSDRPASADRRPAL